MVFTLSASIVTLFFITSSVLFFPSFHVKKLKLQTYWIVALIGAIIVLFANPSLFGDIWQEFTSSTPVNPLKILILFFSMTVLSVFLDEVGLFQFLATKAVHIAKTNQFTLFFVLYGLVSLLTIFTSNDVVILTLTPFIVFFCKNTKVSPIPYLVAAFAAANTWSIMFIIGNPTNIYLGTSAGIDFASYFSVMALPTIACGLVELLVLVLIFRKKLLLPMTPVEEKVSIGSKPDVIIGLIHLVACLVFLVISGYLNIQMWMISMICALSLLVSATIVRLITKRHWDYLGGSLARLPYQLIPFVLSMFIIVLALNKQGVSARIGEFLSAGNPIWAYGSASLLASNLVNNIPMSILFSSLPNGLMGTDYAKAIYASIIGSNIGAFLTPIGALAGIMFSGLLEQYGIKYGFKEFVKYGLLIAPITLVAALGTLALVLR